MPAMKQTAVVRIVSTRVACAEGIKDTWREVSKWVAHRLAARFGDSVAVEYFDLCDLECPPVPPDIQLPFITVNGEALSSGGKISLPTIHNRLEELGIRPTQEPE